MQKVKVVNKSGSKELIEIRFAWSGVRPTVQRIVFPGQTANVTVSGGAGLQVRRLTLTGKPKTAWRTVIKAAFVGTPGKGGGGSTVSARGKAKRKVAKKRKPAKKTTKRKTAKKRKVVKKRKPAKKKVAKKRKVTKKKKPAKRSPQVKKRARKTRKK